MEGRKPPPSASHPFPNNPDMTKFWGTPYAGSFFRCYAVFIGSFLTFSAFNMYITRNQKGPFGLDVTMTPEQQERRKQLLSASGDIILYKGLALDFKHRANQFSTDPDMRFDDRVDFNVDPGPRYLMTARE